MLIGVLQCARITIEDAVLDGFCDVMFVDCVAGFEVGDGAADAQDLGVGAQREVQAVDAAQEQRTGLFIERALERLRAELACALFGASTS